MTRQELIELLRASELPKFCITDQYVTEMPCKSDDEIHADITDINSFWVKHCTQHRYGRGEVSPFS